MTQKQDQSQRRRQHDQYTDTTTPVVSTKVEKNLFVGRAIANFVREERGMSFDWVIVEQGYQSTYCAVLSRCLLHKISKNLACVTGKPGQYVFVEPADVSNSVVVNVTRTP